MKKVIKIAFVNIVFFCILVFVLEFICFWKVYKISECILNAGIKECLFTNYKFKYTDTSYAWREYKYFGIEDFRPPSVISTTNNKKSIVLLGCSYVWGDYLEYEEIFSSVLSKYTKRNVYNLALSGGSLKEMLYILRNNNLLAKLVPNKNDVEYVIYTYIGDHRNRLYFNFRPKTPHFKKVNHGKQLEYIEDNPLLYSLLNDKIVSNYVYRQILPYSIQKLYTKETYREVQKQFPNSTFVILVYYDYGDENWDELRKKGVIVINANELVHTDVNGGKEYQVPDGHPNGKAWELIVPALAKELKL